MYIGEETPMEQYINIHDVLQGQRDVCKANAMRAKDVKDATDATDARRALGAVQTWLNEPMNR